MRDIAKMFVSLCENNAKFHDMNKAYHLFIVCAVPILVRSLERHEEYGKALAKRVRLCYLVVQNVKVGVQNITCSLALFRQTV